MSRVLRTLKVRQAIVGVLAVLATAYFFINSDAKAIVRKMFRKRMEALQRLLNDKIKFKFKSAIEIAVGCHEKATQKVQTISFKTNFSYTKFVKPKNQIDPPDYQTSKNVL